MLSSKIIAISTSVAVAVEPWCLSNSNTNNSEWLNRCPQHPCRGTKWWWHLFKYKKAVWQLDSTRRRMKRMWTWEGWWVMTTMEMSWVSMKCLIKERTVWLSCNSWRIKDSRLSRWSRKLKTLRSMRRLGIILESSRALTRTWSWRIYFGMTLLHTW